MTSSDPGFEPVAFEGPDFADDDESEDLEDFDDNAGNVGNVADDAGNRMDGGAARAVLEHVARSIVDEPEAVVVEVGQGRSGTRLSLHVAPSDMGRIIGRRGRVAQAIRTLVRAAGAKEGNDASVDIVD